MEVRSAKIQSLNIARGLGESGEMPPIVGFSGLDEATHSVPLLLLRHLQAFGFGLTTVSVLF